MTSENVDVSLLLPTRGRPRFLSRLLDSVVATTARLDRIEIILYIDEDDVETQEVSHPALSLVKLVRPRGKTMGHMNQACFEASRGRYAMLFNDDAVCRTKGWDLKTISAFSRFPDDIALVYGNDLHRGRNIPTFPILSRAVCGLIGGICPRDYRNIFIDVHIQDVFRQLAGLGFDRTLYLEDVVFEHMHHEAGKAAMDEVYVKRHEQEDGLAFIALDDERRSNARALARYIKKKRRLKILQVGKYSREYSGGMEKAVFTLSRELANEHEVEILASSLDCTGASETDGGLSYHRLPTWARWFSTPITPGLIARLWRARDFDIIQISLQNPMAVAAYLLARPRGALVLWYQHDIVRQKFLGALIQPFLLALLRRADAIVVASPGYAAGSALLRGFKEKVTVIPLGIDEAALQYPAAPRRGPLVLFIGRLVYYKGLPYLIEAMRGLDATLLIVGSGPLEVELKASAPENVVFENVAASDSVGPYIHACDMLVLPSTERTEAFGLALVEAMACGKPVITTELGTGTSFICQHGMTGLVVPPRNAAALREAVKSLLDDPERARRMGAAGRRRFEEKFSSRMMARSFAELYGRLLSRSPGF